MAGVLLQPRIAGFVLAIGLLSGCVPLPVQPTPSVTGRVIDAETGRGIEGAIVVARFDVRRDELLSERDLIGHREATTDASGAFRVARGAVPGIGMWPRVGMESRVVAVMAPDYRCARPYSVTSSGGPTIRLERASDSEDRRTSCRPVAARPDEAPGYLAAWRALYPRRLTAGEGEAARQIGRLVDARSVFGFGENCEGPATDLSLSPDGNHVAVATRGSRGSVVDVIALAPQTRRVARLRGDPDGSARPRRLAWASATDLVLWEPSRALEEVLAPSADLSAAPPERIWQAPQSGGPAAHADSSEARPRPLELSDVNDERDARWLGRSFRITRRLDPVTGGPADQLVVDRVAGEPAHIALPGEPCGPRGQYGRPHFRIASDGRRALDLRHIDGGCRAVAIDLERGTSTTLAAKTGTATCQDRRQVPLPHLRRAWGGYMQELDDSLLAAGGDPTAAYRIEIASDGSTRLRTRDYLGKSVELVVPPFPMDTPLRRIEVTSTATQGRDPAPAPPPASLPVLEPL